jgi:hypothetical protein
MHQGRAPAAQTHNGVSQHRPNDVPPTVAAPAAPYAPTPAQPSLDESQNASSLDDLIANASQQADVDAAAAVAPPAPAASFPPAAPVAVKEEAGEDKAAKKEKDKEKPKSTRLVYSDNETSPEEKMAVWAKYAFNPAQKTIAV